MKEIRRDYIRNYLKTNTSASTIELSEMFNVSQNTIRRDFDYLEENGEVSKVHGGVIIKNQLPQATPYIVRDSKLSFEKEKISQLAASQIEEGDFIFIDAGTTTRNILNYIDPSMSITVVTNNAETIINAIKMENINLFILGNRYNKKTKSFLDSGFNGSPDFLKSLTITKAFMGSTGISISKGLTNYESEEIPYKKIVVETAKEIYLLADNTKIDNPSLISYFPLQNIDVFITNQEPPKDYIEFFEQNDVEYLFNF